jgi:hypothetical protein
MSQRQELILAMYAGFGGIVLDGIRVQGNPRSKAPKETTAVTSFY